MEWGFFAFFLILFHNLIETIMMTLIYSFTTIWLKMKDLRQARTFKEVFEEYLVRMNNKESIKSHKLYSVAGNKFITFMKRDFTLSSITPKQIDAYAKHLFQQNLSDTTVRIYLTLIKVILNYAIKLGYVNYKIHPFVLIKLPTAKIRNLDLSIKELRCVRDVELSNPLHLYTRDIFMLTYYLGGINLRDLTAYNFNNQTVMQYIRHKTRQSKKGDNMVVFAIQPEAQEIINKYIRDDGHLHFGKYHTYEKVYSLVSRYLPLVSAHAGINKKISYYSARKSFAQHGYELGIPLEQIEYCLGHSMKNNRPIFNYVRIMSCHADKVIRMILDGLQEK